MPILFSYQQYFLACALFGLGLGFFKYGDGPAAIDPPEAEGQSLSFAVDENKTQTSEPEPLAAEAQPAPQEKIEVTFEDDETQPAALEQPEETAKVGETQGTSVDEEKSETSEVQSGEITSSAAAADKQKKSADDGFTATTGISWAVWLTVLMLILLWVVTADVPGGLPNAMNVTLQDESADVYMSAFDNKRMAADIISVGLFGTMLFAWVQIFVAPGQELKRRLSNIQGGGLCLFAAAAGLAWGAAALVAFLSLPPAVLLIPAGAILLWLCRRGIAGGAWLAAAMVLCFLGSSVGLRTDVGPAAGRSPADSTFIAAGSRVDTRSILNGDKVIAYGVWLDRALYQLLPAVVPTEQETASLQKQCSLPSFACPYKDLLYRVMPDMKGKSALVLDAGIGSEVSSCLYQGLAHVTAVEPAKWLTDLSQKQASSPYSNKAVTLVNAEPRQFLRANREKYDLIIYSGHPPQSRRNPFLSINHDDYDYTVEALFDAFAHLKDDGELVIITPAGNELVRTKIAANIVALNAFVDAQLTTPYANILVAMRTPLKDGPAGGLVDNLRRELGAKIVNRESLLMNQARRTIITRDDRPFIPGWGPMIPLADSFLAILTMVAMLLSLRLQARRSMLQNISNARCRAYLLGVTVGLLLCRGFMTVTMAYGIQPRVIYLSLIFAWLAIALGAAAAKLKSPGWLWWGAFGLVLLVDLAFYYEAAIWLPGALPRLISCAVLPLAPAALASLLLSRELREGKGTRESFGLALAGLSLGCLLTLTAMFYGTISLGLFAAALAITVLLLTFRRQNGQNTAKLN